MKYLLLFVALVSTSTAQAAWMKIFDCNHGEFVLDADDDTVSGRPNYQFVLRGQPLQYFIDRGAVNRKAVNEKAEFILPMIIDGNRFVSNVELSQNHILSYSALIFERNLKLVAQYKTPQAGTQELATWNFRDCHR